MGDLMLFFFVDSSVLHGDRQPFTVTLICLCAPVGCLWTMRGRLKHPHPVHHLLNNVWTKVRTVPLQEPPELSVWYDVVPTVAVSDADGQHGEAVVIDWF